MSTSRSQLSASSALRIARPDPRERSGDRAAAREPTPREYNGRPRAVPDVAYESFGDRAWDERVAREVRHREIVEASFDRAEAYERLGDFERALDWLDRAAAVGGGLPAAYRARRARWARAAAFRPRPAGGERRKRFARSGGGAAGQ